MAEKKIDITIGTSYDSKGVEAAQQGMTTLKKV